MKLIQIEHVNGSVLRQWLLIAEDFQQAKLLLEEAGEPADLLSVGEPAALFLGDMEGKSPRLLLSGMWFLDPKCIQAPLEIPPVEPLDFHHPHHID